MVRPRGWHAQAQEYAWGLVAQLLGHSILQALPKEPGFVPSVHVPLYSLLARSPSTDPMLGPQQSRGILSALKVKYYADLRSLQRCMATKMDRRTPQQVQRKQHLRFRNSHCFSVTQRGDFQPHLLFSITLPEEFFIHSSGPHACHDRWPADIADVCCVHDSLHCQQPSLSIWSIPEAG